MILDFVRGTRLKIAGLTAFKKGTPVCPAGLQFHTTLNGRLGTIAGYDDSRKRWVVDMGEGLGKKLFHEVNLKLAFEPVAPPAPPDPALLRKVSLPEAKLPAPGTDTSLAAISNIDVEPIQLSEGVQVRIMGLGAKHEELNGQRGSIIEYNEDKQRWVVLMEYGLGKKMFKDANLVVERSRSMGRPGTSALADPSNQSLQGRVPPADGSTASGPRLLRPGAQVLVEGLPGGSLARLNGKVGVCERCEFMTGCWTVFFADGNTESLRPEYLSVQPATLRPGAYVKLHSLQSAVHLNGMLGVCGQLDPDSLRWEVQLETGEKKSLKSDNLKPQDSYTAPKEDEEQAFAAGFEAMLQSGEISWLDC